MSCCGGNCGCGSGCKCDSGCEGCKMHPDLVFAEAATTTTATIISGVAPVKARLRFEESEMGVGAQNGCKCGDDCKCKECGDDCKCKECGDDYKCNPCTCNK